jgi:hypothetical protein
MRNIYQLLLIAVFLTWNMSIPADAFTRLSRPSLISQRLVYNRNSPELLPKSPITGNMRSISLILRTFMTSMILPAFASDAAEVAEADPDALSTGTFDTLIDPMAAASFSNAVQLARPPLSDEIDVSFLEESLGLGLREEGYKGFPVTVVSSIKDPKLVSTYNNAGLREGSVISRITYRLKEGKDASTREEQAHLQSATTAAQPIIAVVDGIPTAQIIGITQVQRIIIWSV